mmetsp:Transcript_5268/g.12534  ORF Transcript_5268/g.12534 Transcript_5268/m.12534 type:complete len:215 (-) Transcript_5268:220-864(-)
MGGFVIILFHELLPYPRLDCLRVSVLLVCCAVRILQRFQRPGDPSCRCAGLTESGPLDRPPPEVPRQRRGDALWQYRRAGLASPDSGGEGVANHKQTEGIQRLAGYVRGNRGKLCLIIDGRRIHISIAHRHRHRHRHRAMTRRDGTGRRSVLAAVLQHDVSRLQGGQKWHAEEKAGRRLVLVGDDPRKGRLRDRGDGLRNDELLGGGICHCQRC